MTDDELHYISASDALRRFRDRSLSPVELMTAIIARCEQVDPKVNALPMRYFDEAPEQARRAEKRYGSGKGAPRALEGIPIAIKDETPLKGRRTTQGSILLKDQIDESTNPSAERILRAGAIVHARSATPEFCCAGFTWSRLWGVTRLPWNLEYSPGGSSGGAGAALAAGTTTLANGSDIAGSIRIPASACGVVGYKPPYGRNPDSGPFNLDWYNHVGPLARTVADCALLQNVMSGPHPRDIATVRPKVRIPSDFKDIKGWQVALSIDLDVFEVDREVEKNTREAARALQEAGARVEEVQLGWSQAIKRNLWTHLGVIMGPYIRRYFEQAPDLVSDYVREFVQRTSSIGTDDLLASLVLEGEMYEKLGNLFRRFRLLICPTLAVPSVPAEHNVRNSGFTINGKPVDANLDWCLTYPFNMMSRCPVLSVPSGFAPGNLPTGLQIVGRPFDDAAVFRAGAALERARPWFDSPDRRPRL